MWIPRCFKCASSAPSAPCPRKSTTLQKDCDVQEDCTVTVSSLRLPKGVSEISDADYQLANAERTPACPPPTSSSALSLNMRTNNRDASKVLLERGESTQVHGISALHHLCKLPEGNDPLAWEESLPVQDMGGMIDEIHHTSSELQHSISAPLVSPRAIGSQVRVRRLKCARRPYYDTSVKSLASLASSPTPGVARLRLWTHLVQEANGGKNLLQLIAESRSRSITTHSSSRPWSLAPPLSPLSSCPHTGYSRHALAGYEDNSWRSRQRCVSCHITAVKAEEAEDDHVANRYVSNRL
ncbi:hypothetical protein CEUSTIGMA_g13308.t1 [Chlamydomonas eustigma]|uniref:Uncharacterized protein n=1 Tax=Chlamydomonas eustigma TaxID=1157962 RepID=A0A250XSI8_9CHLO|nr:hypothetical protein CEUSTIGMA_g13308.t1 [Chlamydomonas eustigma]|eukprot:GAX85892.1 hypothetical protein CEUSTIGMA_g13308.t1 [Chlamydomonas eustigma]